MKGNRYSGWVPMKLGFSFSSWFRPDRARKRRDKPIRTVVINATNIGRKLNGISVYTLSLIKGIAHLQVDLNFVIYLNKNSREHVAHLDLPENCRIKWTTRYISPDYKFVGHLLRLIYANLLPLREADAFFFNTSQLEAMFFKREQILTVHDITPLLFGRQHKKQYVYFRYFLKFALNRARVIITPSFYSQGQIRKFYRLPANKTRVIYHGIEAKDFPISGGHPAGENNDFLLFVGRSSPTKNISGLLKAFEILKPRIRHKLILVGAGFAEVAAGLLNDGERVEVKGYLPLWELADLYKRASLLILPSFYEGFGFTPMEAMARGCPVLVSNRSSLPEICGEAACYVNPYSIESIADGIQKILTNESMRKNLIARGLERAKTFTWEKSAKEHCQVFTGLLSC